jgi:hypothetical protein
MANLRFHTNVFAEPFQCSWEEAAQALKSLPRMLFEPDGSWIWSGGVGRQRWQVDGHLFDFSERLHRVELRGECPSESLDCLLGCFGWPGVSLEFEQVREGTRLDETAFREAAAR